MTMKTELSKVMNGELKIMKEMPIHKNIICLHEIIDDEDEDKLMIVIDHCEKGQVMTWHVHGDTMKFKPSKSLPCVAANNELFYSENTIKQIIRDTAEGLRFCH
jgi:serine/threonine protein kinase